MYESYKNKLNRKLYLQNWRKKNKIKRIEYRKNWLKKHPGYLNKYRKRNKEGYIRTKPYSYFFKNSSPISKICIQRHGLNAIKIYEKYNRKCVYCGQDWDLTIHHLDNKGRNKLENKENINNELNNLILLCRKCHGSIHGKQGGRPKS